MQILNKVIITQNYSGHPFKLGEEVTIFRIFADDFYDVCNKSGDCWKIHEDEFLKQKTYISMQQMTDAVINTAQRLLKAQNTVTNLEIKTELMKTHKNYFWTQATVSSIMNDAYNTGLFTYTDNGTYRTYSLIKKRKVAKAAPTMVKIPVKKTPVKKTVQVATPTRKATIGRKKALELMQNNRGHFFTATFISKKGERTINCQYLKDQENSVLGYVKVREASKAKMDPKDSIRQINVQTLSSLKIAGRDYNVR